MYSGNQMSRCFLVVTVLLVLCWSTSADLACGQTIIASEDFDGGAVNLIEGFDSSLEFYDSISYPHTLFGVFEQGEYSLSGVMGPFSLVDESVFGECSNGEAKPFKADCEGIFGSGRDDGDAYFTACSYDSFLELNDAFRTATWLFDVSSAVKNRNLSLSIDMGQMSNDEFDGVVDFSVVSIQYSFDGGPYFEAMTLGTIELVGTGFQYRGFDNGNVAAIDFFGDGTHRGFGVFTPGVTKISAETGLAVADTILDKSELKTGKLDTYRVEMFGSGDTLEVRMIVDLPYEAFAIDNIQILGEDIGVLKGDVDLSGAVNLLDVDDFIDRLSKAEYQAEADCNCDGVLNLLDVDFFIAILGGN